MNDIDDKTSTTTNITVEQPKRQPTITSSGKSSSTYHGGSSGEIHSNTIWREYKYRRTTVAHSPCTNICSLHCVLNVECPRLNKIKLLDSTTSQTIVKGWGKDKKLLIYDLLFHLFPTIAPLLHGPKINRLNKIKIPARNYTLSEGSSSTSWRNVLGNFLLNYMVDYQVQLKVLTNIIPSNPIPNMVVTFLLVTLHLQRIITREVEEKVIYSN